MKKIRMIVTSVIVLAMVSSSLAFTAKRVGVFCRSTTNTKNQNCAVVHNLFIGTGLVNTFIKINWNGQTSDCTPNDCPDPVRLESFD